MISLDAMKDECSIRRRTEGAFGPTYEPGIQSPCYFEPGGAKITDREGEDVTSDGTLFLPPDVAVGPGDLVELGGARYEVIRLNAYRPKGQPHHTEVALREIA